MARYHFTMDQTRKQVQQLVRARRPLPPPERRVELRKAARLRLKDIADLIGVTPTTVWNWERGIEPKPRYHDKYREVLEALAGKGAAS